jgi:hypothetical protein
MSVTICFAKLLSFGFSKEPQNEIVDIGSAYLHISFSVLLINFFFRHLVS